ncbi:MAG TPA: hypothetical protein PLX45_19245, partial [Piscinibacter sp.]|nr:hypothetical protein [Piscinibacter sp.]
MDTHRRGLLLGLALAPLAAHANVAAPPEVVAELPGAQLLGNGRLSFLGLHIYDARLWIDEGFSADRFDRHA